MTTTPLGIVLLADAQANKSVTVNAGIVAVENESNALIPIVMTDADIILTAAQIASGAVFVVTGTLTADRNFCVPVTPRRFVVKNNTTGGHSLGVKTVTGGGITLTAANGYKDFYSDGTNVVAIA